ncbi:MAG TPA: PqqD family protein [Acidobacteriaceae bacterium]|nr:PqqD family protein [Acidobacteriaceae bacterium]
MTIQPMGAESLLYDEQRHMAFCLNATSAAVWRLADGTRSIAQIASAASSELSAEITPDLVCYALEELRRDGLVLPSQPTGQPAQPSISRRAALARLGVAGAALLPIVASIVAPTAAQAYSGCVNCLVSPRRQLRKSTSPLSQPSPDPDQ